MDQTSQGQMPFMFPLLMMGNMQEIIDKKVSELLSKQMPADLPKELDRSESGTKHRKFNKFQPMSDKISYTSEESENDRDLRITESSNKFYELYNRSEKGQSTSFLPSTLKIDLNVFFSIVTSDLGIPL